MVKGANANQSSSIKKEASPLKLVLNENINAAFTPHFQQVKSPATPTVIKSRFYERWVLFLAEHKTCRLIARAQAAIDTSGKLLSEIRAQDDNGTQYAVYGEKLAKGGSGKVNIAQNLTTKVFCILKRSTDGDEKALDEVAILKQLDLFEGIGFKTRKDETRVSYIFMKQLPGITLHDFKKLCKKHKQTLSLPEQAKLLLSTLQAIQQLIKQHINHGDVHDKNILFDPLTWQSHFIDFGDSSIISSNGSQNHHQHYDIKKLLQALNDLVTHSALLAITQQYLYSWTGLERNLQLAIDSVRILAVTEAPKPGVENTNNQNSPTKKSAILKR